MIYNIAKNSMVSVDTDETTVDISIGKLLDMLDVSEEPIATLSGTDKFVLQCDLGSRIHLSDIVYHFKSSYVPAGTVSFLYKNEPFQDYVSLNIYADEDSYRTTVSGYLGSDPFAPRYIRIEHDLTSVSGTVSGTLHGFETLTDDRIVNFGADGTSTEAQFEVARGGLSQIQAVPIYNSGESIVDAFISLEPTFTDVDDIISISLSDEGPWTYSINADNLIADSSNFNLGIYNNVAVNDARLTITSWVDGDGTPTYKFTSGEYTTKVFTLPANNQNRLLANVDLTKGGYLTYDDANLTQTIEVRSSNYKPVDYNTYREIYQYYDGSSKYISYRDRWTIDGSIKENHNWYFLNASRYSEWRSYYLTMDNSTERTAGFVYHWNTDTSSYGKLILINNIGTTAKTYTVVNGPTTSPIINTIREVMLDVTGGVWIYFYAQTYNAADFVDDTGYYLAYFDANLTNHFKYFSASDFIGDMAVNYDNTSLWYTYPGSETILNIDNEGSTLLTLTNDDTDYLGGITVMYDGTVWYSNDGDLVHISSSGSQIDKITGPLDELEAFNKLAADPNSYHAIWAIWGFNVYRLYVSGPARGTIDIHIYIEGALSLYPTKHGCWVWVADISGAGFNHMQFISRANKRVDLDVKVNEAYSTSSAVPSNSVFAPMDLDWEDDLYVEKMPLAIDNVWKDLEYTQVPIENFLFSEDDIYYQARFLFKHAPAYEKYDLPYGTDYVNDDDFNQVDGPPEKIQLWGRWSNNDHVYVENNELVMIGGQNCWIDTYKRMLVSGNLDFRWYFSVGETNPVSSSQYVYLYIYAMATANLGSWVRVQFELKTDGQGQVVCSSSGGSSTGSSYMTINALNTGLRVYVNNGDYRAQLLNSSGNWEGTLGFNSIATNYGGYFYPRLYKGNSSETLRASSFSTVGGNVYYYSGSPGLNSVYTQESLKLTEVHPNIPQNVYVRAQVGLNKDVSYQEEAQLRVKWRQPVP
jgi:hypothetical protein